MEKAHIVFLLAAMSASLAAAGQLRLRESALWQPPSVMNAQMSASVSPDATAGENAIKAVCNLQMKLGIKVGKEHFRMRRAEVDARGRTHVRLVQLHRGIEVDGRELVVHFDASGSVYEVNGDYLDGLALDVTPAAKVEGATLVVYCKGDDAAHAHLAWRAPRGRTVVFTDAQTGDTLHIRRLATRKTGKKTDGYALPVDKNALVLKALGAKLPEGEATTLTGNLPMQQGGKKVAVAATRGTDGKTYFATKNAAGVEICLFDGIAAPAFRDAAYAAYRRDDANWFATFADRTTFTRFSAAQEEDMSTAFAIMSNASSALDYFLSAFGRRSYDDRGTRVALFRFWNDSIYDFDSGYNNASWSICDDDATKGCMLVGYDLSGSRNEASLDSCVHEFAHGITFCTAALEYEAEPGALNESFSDILAANCEFAVHPRAADMTKPNPGEADWLFDEDSGEAARSLAEPGLYGQPARYRGVYWVDTKDVSEGNDYGGVHSNSGVQNFFYYLLCEGGVGDNDGTLYALEGIGVEKAQHIAYLALTAYCTPRTDYAAVIACWDSAAQDLRDDGVLTDADVQTVSRAWAAVMPSVAPFAADADAVYGGSAEGAALLVLTKKATSRGVVAVAANLTSGGRVYKLSGKMSADDAKVSLSNRSVGTLTLSFERNYARGTFAPSESGKVALSGEIILSRISPEVSHINWFGDLRVGVIAIGEIILSGRALSVRYATRKLPSGVSGYPILTYVFGVPRKAGKGVATITAKCSVTVKGARRPVKVAVSGDMPWTVAPLDDYALGTFEGEGLSFRVTKALRINGSVTVDGKKYKFSGKGYDSYNDGVYARSTEAPFGTFSLAVGPDGATGHVTTETGEITFSAPKIR